MSSNNQSSADSKPSGASSTKPDRVNSGHTPVLYDSIYRTSSQKYCGMGSLVGMSPDLSKLVVIPLRCKAWDCPTCGPIKRYKLIARILSGRPSRFITLPIKPDKEESIGDAFDRLKDCFRDLVKRIRRRFGCFEYALTLEVSKGGIPHMHICARCSYIKQSWLSDNWMQLTGSFRVDIRKIDKGEYTAAYITKYLTKDASKTVKCLEGKRFYQISKRYEIKESKVEIETNPEVMRWQFIKEHPCDVLQSLPSFFLYYDGEFWGGGNCTLVRSNLPERAPKGGWKKAWEDERNQRPGWFRKFQTLDLFPDEPCEGNISQVHNDIDLPEEEQITHYPPYRTPDLFQ